MHSPAASITSYSHTRIALSDLSIGFGSGGHCDTHACGGTRCTVGSINGVVEQAERHIITITGNIRFDHRIAYSF